MKSLFPPIITLLVSIQLISLPMSSSRASEFDSAFDHFITRDSDRLMEGDVEFRFAGANMPGLSLPYDYTLRFPNRLVLPTPWEQENGMKTLVQMNARVVRLWNLPMRGPDDDWMDWAYVQAPGQFNEEAFKTLDRLLALANKYGIRIIFSLSAEAGDYLGGIGEYAAWVGVAKEDFYTNEACKSAYKATLSHVINRRNTVTGELYKNDKSILAWQLGNELRGAPLEWEAEMADYIKSIDSNHLVMAGNDSRIPDSLPESIDIVTRHYYGGQWVQQCREDRALAKGKRPFIIGEYGLTTDSEETRRLYEEALSNGTSGHLLWSLYFHHRSGGFYWHQIFTHPSIGSFHWPGFESGSAHNEREILAGLREYAFKMQGLEESPVPVPDTPDFLPFGELPMLSWLGSAGATGYDIERSQYPYGTWELVANNVSDANVAYRPLWVDETAVPGVSYCYRISARNVSGVSDPSAVTGPVSFDARVLVDEFANLDKVHSHSSGLTLDNSYNGLYAEYLFRAKGKAGDQATYQIPGKIKHIRIWAFHDENVEVPKIFAMDGESNSSSIPVETSHRRTLQSFAKVTQLQGLKRILVRYESDLSGLKYPVQFLRIQWAGQMEIDRIEIEYH